MSEKFDAERLDSPLVVHKKTDASYLENAGDVNAPAAEKCENNQSNLVRHRFRRVKRRRKAPYIILAAVIIAAVLVGLYYGGIIGSRNQESETQTTSRPYIEVTENKFEGIITVKKTYIFFEGEEMNNLEELERKVKYLDEGTKFVVQDEDADPILLNEEILPLLKENGIDYGEGPKYILSSGLKSKSETEAEAQPQTDVSAQAVSPEE